jgi:hypothetical protein
MKKIFLVMLLATAIINMYSQNVGIGTTTPLARLHVTDSSVLFSATGAVPFTPGNPPISGAGRRMMWYADKAAFRAGYTSTFWDKDSIGNYSTAFGYLTKAKGLASSATGYYTSSLGDYSTAMGSFTTALGDYSTAMGLGPIASGSISTAMGNNTAATGHSSTAMGWETIASGSSSTAMGAATRALGIQSTAMGNSTIASGNYSTANGLQTTASGYNSTTMGYLTNASGQHAIAMGELTNSTGFATTAMGSSTLATGDQSVAMGYITKARGYNSTSMGHYTIAKSDYSLVMGRYNDTTDVNRLFEIGNGTADNARGNAITVLLNGKAGIGTTSPAARLHVADSSVVFTAPATLPVSPGNTPVSGPGNRMMWYADKAAFRAGNIINDSWDKDKIGNVSFATGSNTQASGITSFAAGNFSFATGDISAAFGNSIYAKARNAFTIGSNNDNTDSPSGTSESTNDRIFQIGNGASNISRSNAMTVLRNGNVGIGTLIPNARLDITGTTTFRGSVNQSFFNYSGTEDTYIRGGANSSKVYINDFFGAGVVSIGNSLTGSAMSHRFRVGTSNIASIVGGYSDAASFGFTTSSGNNVALGIQGYRTTAGTDWTGTALLLEMDVDNAFRAAGSGSGFIALHANGNIGIGTAKPNNKLEVVGNNGSSPVFVSVGNYAGFGSAGIEFISDYTSNVQWRPGYIKTSDAGSFTGSVEVYTNGTGAGNYYTSVKGFEVRNGVAYTATGTVSSFSDIRVKKNIQPFNHGLDVITKINPVSFNYNNLSPFITDKKQIGIIAQDLERIAPYMVDKTATNEMNDLRSVNNQAYTFLLINAVKELAAQNEKQQKQIDAQNKIIEELIKHIK